jgi:bacillithiol system protein YtxJ
MNWIEITNESQLSEVKELSKDKPQLIFKHSTRCSISSMAKSRLEKGITPGGIAFYYLDLIKHRNISQKVAEVFAVSHESPQILLIKNGECVYDESHSGITMDEIVEQSATI